MSVTREEAAHILEYSRIVSENFTQEAVTATYVMALAALHGPTREMVERMRGEWQSLHGLSEYYCSRCGDEFEIHSYDKDKYQFCPHCMAPMTDEAVDILWKRWKEAFGC